MKRLGSQAIKRQGQIKKKCGLVTQCPLPQLTLIQLFLIFIFIAMSKSNGEITPPPCLLPSSLPSLQRLFHGCLRRREGLDQEQKLVIVLHLA